MIVLVLLILVASIVYLYSTRRTARSTAEHGREAEKTYESTHNSADRALRSRLGLTTQCRPVTIAVSPALCAGTSGEALAAVVTKLSSFTPVHIICEASNDAEETVIRNNLALLVPDFPSHHILIHGSEVGKTAIVRQLAPSIHIDHDFQFCLKLKPHLKRIVLLDCTGSYNNGSLDPTVAAAAQDELSQARNGILFPRISTIEQLLDLDLS